MLKSEYRRIKIHRQTALLGIDERLSRSITKRNGCLCYGKVVNIIRRLYPTIPSQFTGSQGLLQTAFTGHRPVEQLAARFIVCIFQHHRSLESRFTFQFIFQAGRTFIVILVYGSHLERSEHVILVCSHELVRRQHVVV